VPLNLRKLVYKLTPHRIEFLNQNPWLAAYQVGDYSYGKVKVVSWGEGTTLTIGRFCSIAPTLTVLLGGEHRTDWITTYPFPEVFDDARGISGHVRTKGDVVIGHDVWIGDNVIILSGVRVGNGAVIGARSVVVKDVPPYAVISGNPAELLYYRFSASQVAALERIAWWNWPLERIKALLPTLLSGDVDGFIREFDQPGDRPDRSNA
jgi:acetyltransferase-like isoleucine patch superfamily enzyme